MKRKGFTLIELLIVVAIIAILAAIAVPNFLEAQTRSKVARVKADLRTIGVALESYVVDYNNFPDSHDPDYYTRLYIEYMDQLSTPVAYLSSLALVDPFSLRAGARPAHLPAPPEGWKGSYACLPYSGRWYQGVPWDPAFNGGARKAFVAYSNGPMRKYTGMDHYGYACFMQVPPGDPFFTWLTSFTQSWDGGYPVTCKEDFVYNPTNGTVSPGGIGRFGGDLPNTPQSVGG